MRAVVYDFADSHAGEHARAFLGNWRGKLVCDERKRWNGSPTISASGPTHSIALPPLWRRKHARPTQSHAPAPNQRLARKNLQRLDGTVANREVDAIGPAPSRHATVRPVLVRVIRPPSDNTSRCFMTAGNDIANSCASLLTDRLARADRRARSARRVGSANAV